MGETGLNAGCEVPVSLRLEDSAILSLHFDSERLVIRSPDNDFLAVPERVEAGQEITITKHGTPVAKLTAW